MRVPLEERNISASREARREFQEKGYDTLPTVEVGETVITDYTGEPLLIEVLVREGYL